MGPRETRPSSKVTFFLGILTFKLFPSAGFKYRRLRFGFFLSTVIWACRLVDTDGLQKQHWNLNVWSDIEVQQWKDSQLASCNAIAVAVGLSGRTIIDASTNGKPREPSSQRSA